MDGSLRLQARAKINLCLDVLGRLPNGYHAVETVFHSIELADRLTVTRTRSEIAVESDDPAIPDDEMNLASRAARMYFQFTGLPGGASIRIEKRIPAGGGLGGGSADAAATLVALNELYDTRFPADTLEKIGAALGADVPFCVRGGCAVGWGTGTTLRRVEPLPAASLLLVNPGVHVDTGWAYRALAAPALGRFGLTGFPSGATIVGGWRTALSGAERAFDAPARNRFEAVVFREYPVVREAWNRLRDFGAIAMMSGSGSTVFGVFPDKSSRDNAHASLKDDYPLVAPTTLAPRGVEFDPVGR